LRNLLFATKMLSLFLLSATFAAAQVQPGTPSTLKTFQIYIDRDNDPGTGLNPPLNDGVSIANGVELLLTVTVQAGTSPQVVLVEAQEWDGTSAFLPSYFSDASGWPVGQNNGTGGSDAVEAYMPLDRLGITQDINFYIQSGEAGAPFDIMGPAPFGFGVPIPTLSQWMLLVYIGLFLAVAVWWMRRKSRMGGTLVLLAGLFLVGASATIILDGLVDDWTDPAIATDPINDAAEDSIDLLAFYSCFDNSNLFVRLDVEELENQGPIADDQMLTILEDMAETVTLTATDPNGDPITFTIDTNPGNGMLGAVTSTGPDTADVTYTPDPDFNGNDSFTFQADDLNGSTSTGTIDITISPVNDAPSFTAGDPVSVPKDSGLQTISAWATAISAGPPNESGQNLNFQVTVTSNPQVFSVAPAIDATTGDLTFTPDADNNGTAMIEVVLMDDGGTADGGVDTSATETIAITIGPVNDPPTFTAGADQTHNEDDGAITLNGWATAMSPGPPDEAGQVLTFNANVISDPGGLFSVMPAVNATTGDLTYTLAADAFGTATIDITLMDDGGTANGGNDTSPPQTLTVTVNPVNDAPTFTNAGNVNVFKGGGTETVSAWASMLATGPANESGQSFTGFTVMVTSDPNGVLGSMPTVSTATGDLSFDTTADNNGTATISVTLMDDGGTTNGGVDTSATATVDIIVGGVNDAPSFTAGMDQTHNEDAGAITVNGWATAMSPGPPDEAGQMLTFNANVTSNPGGLFSVMPAVNATTGDLTYTLAADAFGTATIDIILMDDGGTANGGNDTSPPQTLTVTVNPINDAPTFTNAGNVNVFKGGGTETVPAWASMLATGPANESGQSFTGFTVMVTSDPNGVLGSMPTVSTATGDLSFDTTADNNGTATISVTLMDDGGTVNGGVDTSATATVDIIVGGVNDAPSFTVGSDIVIDENDGPQTFNMWATGISAGPPDEAGQMLTFNITGNTNPALFSTAPAVASDGTLTFETAMNANTGDPATPVTITLELMDDGGTANGGVDTSPPQMFTITVNPVNDPPMANDDTYDAAGNTRLEVGTTTAAIGHKISGSVLTDGTPDSDADSPGPLIVTGVSNVTAGASVNMNPDGTFTYSPPPGFLMSDTFDYTISDQDPIAPMTDTATVTINFFDHVWYVQNDHGGSSDGTSDNPFLTLAEAETASMAGHKIFVFIGDGTLTGHNSGILLKDGQSLIGERIDLVLDVNGTPSTIVTGSGVGTMAPRLGNTTGDVVTLADDNVVRGLILLPTASAGILGFEVIPEKQNIAKKSRPWRQKYIDRVTPRKRVGGTTVVTHVIINPANTSDGLCLLGQSGNFTFTDSEIIGLPGNTGRALAVDTCSADFTFDTLTIGSAGTGIELTSNSSPGGIDFTNTTVTDCSAFALDLLDQDDFSFAINCSVNQTVGGGGILVVGGGGTLSFTGPVTVGNLGMGTNAVDVNSFNLNPIVNFGALTIDASTGDHAVLLEDFGATSDINFNGILDINGAGMHGLFLNNVNNTIDVTNTSSDIASATGSGVNISGGTPMVVFNGTMTNNGTSISMANVTGGTTLFTGLISQGAQTSGFVASNCAGIHNVDQANFGTMAARLTGNAINITGSSGSFNIDDFRVFTQGIGLNITGGTPTVMAMNTSNFSQIDSNANSAIFASAGTLFSTLVNTVANSGTNPGISVSGVTGISTFQNIDIDTTSGTGIFFNGIGSANFGAVNTIEVDTTTGVGVDLRNINVMGEIDRVTTTMGTNGGVNLDNLNGSLNFGLVNITSTSGTAFRANNAGTIAVTDNTSSINATGGTALEMNTTIIGGSNMAFATISASNTGGANEGIDLDSVSGGLSFITTITIDTTVSGGNGIDINASSSAFLLNQTDLDTGTNTAVNLTANTGATFNFNNFDIDTTSGDGFNATGGGTVTAGGINTIDTTTGRGIQIDSTNIGSGNFSMRSVNTNGAVNGIRLNATGMSGGLRVNGTGGNNSGGIIQNSTADGIFLNGTAMFDITEMQVNSSTTSHINATNVNGMTLDGVDFSTSGFHGINGNGITALNMSNCTMDLSGNAANEHGLRIINLLGSSNITSSDFTRSATIHAFVQNTSASVAAPAAPTDIVTFDDCSFSNPIPATFGDNISVEGASGSNLRLILDDAVGQNTFVGGQDGVQAVTATGGTLDVIVDNIDVQTVTGAGVNCGGFNASTLTADVRDIDTLNTDSIGINLTSIGGATVSGVIDNNIINGSSVGQGIQVITEGDGNITATVSNNTISNINQEHGIRVQARAGTGTINITIDNNGVDNTASAFPLEGIYVESGSSAGGDLNTICLNMLSNNSAANGMEGYRLRQRAGTTFNLQDFVGNGTVAGDVMTWINTTKGNTGTSQITIGTTFSASAGSCPTP